MAIGELDDAVMGQSASNTAQPDSPCHIQVTSFCSGSQTARTGKQTTCSGSLSHLQHCWPTSWTVTRCRAPGNATLTHARLHSALTDSSTPTMPSHSRGAVGIPQHCSSHAPVGSQHLVCTKIEWVLRQGCAAISLHSLPGAARRPSQRSTIQITQSSNNVMQA